MAAHRISIVSLFPEMFHGIVRSSLIGKAQENKRITINVVNLRDFAQGRHLQCDDKPFGGGTGMVFKVEPIYRCLKKLGRIGRKKNKPWTVYLSPQGKTLTQTRAQELAEKKDLIFFCGHYEGIDERAMEWIDEEISIGDYVLTGGEIPAMVLLDAVARWIPGIVKEERSLLNDSFQNGLLDWPHYTRPRDFQGREVPEVLLSGNHEKIQQWRAEKALQATQEKRPDLYQIYMDQRSLLSARQVKRSTQRRPRKK